ncbi:MAG: M20/M25/M40 family metallo-hydrolase [Byssovorax sp.]
MPSTHRRDRPKPRVAKVTLATLLSITAILALLLLACTTMPGRSLAGPLPPLDAREARYEGERRADVQALAGTIGERNHANAGTLTRAIEHIEHALSSAGYEVHHLPYAVAGQQAENLEVVITGSTKPAEIVVIGAHYDAAMGAPGADDNGSGTAALLALARTFAKEKPERTLRFVAFADEEPPYFWTDTMGSLVYARACKARNENIVAMISLESIGYYRDAPDSQKYPFPFDIIYPSTGNFLAFVGNVDSRSLVRHTVEVFRAHGRLPSEGAAVPGVIPGVGWSDHWSFWEQGYPAVMVSDTAVFRNPYYHTEGDRPDTLDYPRFARAVMGMTWVVADLGGVHLD